MEGVGIIERDIDGPRLASTSSVSNWRCLEEDVSVAHHTTPHHTTPHHTTPHHTTPHHTTPHHTTPHHTTPHHTTPHHTTPHHTTPHHTTPHHTTPHNVLICDLLVFDVMVCLVVCHLVSKNQKIKNQKIKNSKTKIKKQNSQMNKSYTQRPLNTQLLLGITGQAGSSASQLYNPWGIVFDHRHQQIIVADSNNDRLQFFSRRVVEVAEVVEGVHRLKHLKSFGSEGKQLGQFNYPAGLCLQPFTHHLLVCDEYNHRVQVFSLDADGAGDVVMKSNASPCMPLVLVV